MMFLDLTKITKLRAKIKAVGALNPNARKIIVNVFKRAKNAQTYVNVVIVIIIDVNEKLYVEIQFETSMYGCYGMSRFSWFRKLTVYGIVNSLLLKNSEFNNIL